MKDIFLIGQIIVSIALVVLILLQASGTGFGRSSLGGTQASFSRRGLEKVVFKLTFILAGIFIAISILRLII
jgi:preprotein translocase subunit SecG